MGMYETKIPNNYGVVGYMNFVYPMLAAIRKPAPLKEKYGGE